MSGETISVGGRRIALVVPAGYRDCDCPRSEERRPNVEVVVAFERFSGAPVSGVRLAVVPIIRFVRANHPMKLRFALMVLAASAAFLRAENPADFTVESAVDASRFVLSSHRGKIVALHFLLKTECPYCLRHTHAYAALAAGTPEVVHVFLKPDSADEIKQWAGKIKEEGLEGRPVIYRDPDAKLAKAYGIPDGYKFHGQVVHYPALVVLDVDGRELFRHVGKNNSDRLVPASFTTRLAEVKAKK
jgi:peroxiredoxin Q/BCP